MLADTDIALAHLGVTTIVGRGLGAYVALMIAGARPLLVHGAVLCDGPGLWGGATGPTSTSFHSVDPPYEAPDPNALIDLSRDLRPPDYASLFVRLALEHSGLAEPIAVTTVVRPPWLAAVVDEVGVVTGTLAESLALYLP
jgi:pimeloyl-ACP methyl ester carboxylesterase